MRRRRLSEPSRPPSRAHGAELPLALLPPSTAPWYVGFLAPRAPGRERGPMLVLTRKSNQSIMIGDDIEISVLSIMGEKVRIGIQAPRDIPVFRKEVYLEIQHERAGESADAAAVAPAPAETPITPS